MFFLHDEQRRDFVRKTICRYLTKDNRGTYAQGVHKENSKSGISQLKVQGCDIFCGDVSSFIEALPKCVSSIFEAPIG